MDVYLIPASQARYALYCEEQAPAEVEVPATSVWGRFRRIFDEVLAEGEAIRRSPEAAPTRGRVRRWISHKLAEAVAEQRLLWYLRRQATVRLVHPDDVDAAGVLEESRRILQADRDKHRRWLFIDAALVLAATPVAVLPGPNVLAYYFIFRTVGHLLSMRGAQQGMTGTAWELQASRSLTDLRAALTLAPEARVARIAAIAADLGLEHLAPFVDEVSDAPGPTP
jgi:hypothetical protein